MENASENHKPNPNIRILVRNFIIEIIIYGGLVLGYFLIALRYLNGFLTRLYQENLTVYAILALLLILAQGVLLDSLTSFLLNQVKLRRLE